MKFSAATVALFAAVGVSASAAKGNVTYVTEVVDTFVTYCPGPTEIAVGGKTYTITEATTLTITDCGCTVTKPVVTQSSVACHGCGGYTNGTSLVPVPTKPAGGKPGVPAPTGEAPPAVTPTGSAPSTVPTAGAGKMAALSGAGLAGIVGLAAFAL